MEENVEITNIFHHKMTILEDIVKEFELNGNAEQEMSFRIIGEHFVHDDVQQLLMFITGIGGSGKSHVICVMVELFNAPTRSTAVFINGYTIHAMTFLPKRQVPIKQEDPVFCLSNQISQAKSWDASTRDKSFGGINVIFWGDIGQLRPPKSNALYSHVLVNRLTPATTQTIKGQSALHGAFCGSRQNWQAKDDAAFTKKCAVGLTDQSDYDTLKSHHSPAQFVKFKDAPIVVTGKFLQDALNESKAWNFAIKSGQHFEMYHARDKISKKPVISEQQRRLWKMSTSSTSDAIGKLPLIPGISRIINGSRGILKSVTYNVDNTGNKFAVCALVHIPDSTLYIPGLSDKVVPILPVTSSFEFPTEAKKIYVRCIQLLILLGWAFTDYKIQGSTMPKVVIDFTGAKSLQSIYVMLSQASCLEDVVIL
ncbi:hypothetical protein DFJ58DRAFT_716736 [Suillus subalutaceus]|uniref:uncharacterized protein n=1 Tax=Suillus subalutaceus TaxID=48586 RepID=UPI001B865ED7|nr:uncharacterized protein DFJ58DRAFT_716736 [Suillus subalutaceus]KAG1851054.1 hypothetical protein DFJ58DRAFT_716736 [Suillus subalutaceus]